MRVLVTGGAGFIGARFVATLERAGAEAILVYDNLSPQVHGAAQPPVFGPCTELMVADIRDREALSDAVQRFRPTAVVHLAAETGTGQSFDEIGRYVDVNVSGTAYLLEALRRHTPSLNWFMLASSRAVYGEGPYLDAEGQEHTPPHRAPADLAAGQFTINDTTGRPMASIAASWRSKTHPISVYASTKLAQEHLVENVLGVTDTRVVIFRFQNVYGPGQSLINSYTGVLSIFMARLAKGEHVSVFEDGLISRDFVYVDDVIDAMRRAISPCVRPAYPMDIGSGEATLIVDAARHIARLVGRPEIPIPVSGEFRIGDIRCALADIGYAREILDWTPKISLEEGLSKLWHWASTRIAQA